jgi:general secretion pathway protein N
MSLPLPARPRLNHVLAGAAVLLSAAAVYPWLAAQSIPAIATGAAEIPRTAAAITPLPPLASFPAVFERPLFSPSRRPPAIEKPPALGSGLGGRYQLLGLVSAGGTRRALIADGNRRVEIAEGAALDGWTVARIEQDRVVLSSPEGQTVLKLRRAGGVRVDPPASAKPAR